MILQPVFDSLGNVCLQQHSLKNNPKLGNLHRVCLQGVFTEYHTQRDCVTARLRLTRCPGEHTLASRSTFMCYLQPQTCIIRVWLITGSVSSCFISRVIKEGGGEHLNHGADDETAPWRDTQRGESLRCVHRGDASLPLAEHTPGKTPAMAATSLSAFFMCSNIRVEEGAGWRE